MSFLLRLSVLLPLYSKNGFPIDFLRKSFLGIKGLQTNGCEAAMYCLWLRFPNAYIIPFWGFFLRFPLFVFVPLQYGFLRLC